MSKPNNPLAFPSQPHTLCGEPYEPVFGMSLRDYFAGQAMVGFLADGGQRLVAEAFAEDGLFGQQDALVKADAVNKQIAACFYRLADAMLAEREKSA